MGLFSFFRPQITPSQLRMDVHCHLLPGVDDGVPTFEDALVCIKGLIQLGYSGAVLTPHIYPEVFENEEQDLAERFEQFRSRLATVLPQFTVELAAEYAISDRLWKRLRDEPRELLTFGTDRRLLLVELLMSSTADQAQRFLHDCCRAGFQPVLAHVERYPIVDQPGHEEMLDEWRSMGVVLQMNVGSVAGQYGPQKQQVAQRLWRQGRINMVGSDLHSANRLDDLSGGWRWLSRYGKTFKQTSHHHLVHREAEGANS